MPIPKIATDVKKLLDKKKFDRASFRTKTICPKEDGTKGCLRIIIGCPKGNWQPRKKRCKIGTKAHVIYRVPRGYAERTSRRID